MKRRPPTVTELFERQYALASDAQLAVAGVTPLRLKRRLEDGDWRRPCPGVVQLVGAPPDWRQTPMAVTHGARSSGSARAFESMDSTGSPTTSWSMRSWSAGRDDLCPPA